jgi:hypothetical protein
MRPCAPTWFEVFLRDDLVLTDVFDLCEGHEQHAAGGLAPYIAGTTVNVARVEESGAASWRRHVGDPLLVVGANHVKLLLHPGQG